MEPCWGNKTTAQSIKIKTIFEEYPQINLSQDQCKFCEECYYQNAEATTKQKSHMTSLNWRMAVL